MKFPIDDQTFKDVLWTHRPAWAKPLPTTEVGYVNWKDQSVQIKFNYNENKDFSVYVDFPADHFIDSVIRRDQVLAALFKQYKPKEHPHEDLSGYLDWGFSVEEFISPSQALQIAKDLDFEANLIFEANHNRALMADLGLPLLPGESGKQWVDGRVFSHFSKDSSNL